MPSARRATFDDVSVEKAEKFLSTPSARRATVQAAAQAGGRADFYPRPPRGGRPVSQALVWCSVVFLSTPSARRATTFRDPLPLGHGDFYPRPPRGGRPMLFILSAGQKISIHALREEGDGVEQHGKMRPMISIHALREEGDPRLGHTRQTLPNFYPRPPRGGRPGEKVVGVGLFGISIHALREEGDGAYPPWRPARCNFYPRPPRGGRRCIGFAPVSSLVFLSTPSARRATGDVCRLHSCADISIHALREEGDRLQCGTDSA